MRSAIALALLAFFALIAMLLLTLPARLVVSALDTPTALVRPEGSVWSGQARWLQAGQAPLAVEWRWAGGRVWRWRAADGQTDLSGLWRPGRTLVLTEVQGELAVDRVDLAEWLRVSRPVGMLELALERIEWGGGSAPRASGQVVWREAALVGAIQESLGEIGMALTSGNRGLQLEVQSLEPAPIMVRGRIDIDDGRYQVDLWLRAARERPQLQQALIDLGELQPDGQVRLHIQGRSGL